MASKLCTLVFLSVFLLMVVEKSAGLNLSPINYGNAAAAHVYGQNRKVLVVLSGGLPGPARGTAGNGEKLEVRDELRAVPSGPDPLHHNGGSPKKPRNDP